MPPKEKILLIDDDFLVLRTLARVLSAEGYRMTAVDSGVKAVELVKKEDFDLVMSDIRMPEMDGVETVEIIQKHYESHGKSCAFMFITAYPDDRRTKDIESSGRGKLLLKPFEVQDLLGSIELELQARRSPIGRPYRYRDPCG